MAAEKATKSSKQERRLALILERLRESGNASVEALCTDLDVSVHTIRRDLEELRERGLLRRFHGGAAQLEPFFYEPFRADLSFQEQIDSHADEKRRIARTAAAMVSDGDVVGMTPGTTTTETIRCLPLNRRLKVVTNTVNVAMELCNRKDIEVFVTGGNLRGSWFSLTGPTAIQSISKIFLDTLFIGVNAIDAKHGLTCFNSDEAELNRVMVQQARRKIVVADSSKFAAVANWQMALISEIDVLVTDTNASAASVAPFKACGVAVHLV